LIRPAGLAMEPARKRQRFSREPDLEVLVEGEVFHLHSHDLMVASDVFAGMLENEMRESEAGRIVLEGKSQEEFRTLLKYICVTRGEATPDIKKDNVELLLKWADEYQITGLLARCEKFLTKELRKNPKDLPGRLGLAVEYNLLDLQREATTYIAEDVFKYRNDLLRFATSPSIMQAVLPKLYEVAGLEAPTDLPSEALEVKHLWPLVARLLEAIKGFETFENCQVHATMYREASKAVLDSLHVNRPRSGRPPWAAHGCSMEQIKMEHRGRFSAEYIEEVVTALHRLNHITEHAPGRYFRTSTPIRWGRAAG